MLVNIKKLVALITRSTSSRDRLASLQERAIKKYNLDLERGFDESEDPQLTTPVGLVKYVITRWSSAFYMMERVQKLRPFLTKMIAEDPSLPQLNATDWLAIEQLLKLLRPFADATRELEGDKYPTLPKVWRYLSILSMVCKNPATNDFLPSVREVRDRLLEGMREDSDEASIKVDDLLRAAAIADPIEKVTRSHVRQLTSCRAFGGWRTQRK